MSGKIQIIKTFAMPKFIYRASVLTLDKQAIVRYTGAQSVTPTGIFV